MTCTPGLPGGFDDGKIVDRNCTRDAAFSTAHLLRSMSGDEHALLCVSDHHSSFLGRYYEDVRVVKSGPVLDFRFKSFSDAQTNYERDVQSAGVVADESKEAYEYGESVRTVYDQELGITGKLHLPANGFGSGACIASPIKFLVPFSSSCQVDLRQDDICSGGNGSFLDYLLYLKPASHGKSYPSVKAALNASNSAKVKLKYFTSQAAYKYIKTSGRNSNLTPKRVDIAPEIMNNLIQNSPEFFGDERKGGSLDLFYDALRDVCANVILEVHYIFRWSGNQIDQVEANIILGNVTMESHSEEKRTVTQLFSAEFKHSSDRGQKKRPGNPGYEMGRPLISGMKTWSGVSSSLCRDDPGRDVAFGENVLTGCLIQLEKFNFTDCQSLSSAIQDIQNVMTYSEHVAKGGTQDNANDTHISVIYEDDLGGNWTKIDYTRLPVDVCSVPSQVQVQILYSKALVESATDIYRINGVRVKQRFSNWTWTCVQVSAGKCEDVVNYQLRLDVFFEEIPLRWHLQNTSR